MALSEEQRLKVILHLGYPATSIMPGSTDYSRGLMARLITLSPAAEVLVVTLLAKIDASQAKLEQSGSRMLVKRVGDIELNPDEHNLLSREHRRLIRELSTILSIPSVGRGSSIGIHV